MEQEAQEYHGQKGERASVTSDAGQTTNIQLILVDAKPAVRKQILRELQIMNDCASPYIVSYYGCFPVDVHVGIVMEYMDLGCVW